MLGTGPTRSNATDSATRILPAASKKRAGSFWSSGSTRTQSRQAGESLLSSVNVANSSFVWRYSKSHTQGIKEEHINFYHRRDRGELKTHGPFLINAVLMHVLNVTFGRSTPNRSAARDQLIRLPRLRNVGGLVEIVEVCNACRSSVWAKQLGYISKSVVGASGIGPYRQRSYARGDIRSVIYFA